MIIALPDAELDPALAVVALSTIPEGALPSKKEEPHSDCRGLATEDAVLGKELFKTWYAALTQFVQVMLEGIFVEVVNAFSMTSPTLLRLRVPRIAWMFVSVCVMQFVPESVKHTICLAVG